MWIAKNNDLIILAKDTREELVASLGLMTFTDIVQTDIDYQFYDGKYLTREQVYEKEQERIQSLYMTRSDFFDGMIKAFGADSDDLLIAIESVLNSLQISEIEKKVAINNYKNALNFYRKHPLFTLLSNVPIIVLQGTTIIITEEQWDQFFSAMDAGDEDAYKYLLPQS